MSLAAPSSTSQSFFSLLRLTSSLRPSRCWKSVAQHQQHMVTSLAVSLDRFSSSSVSLLFLAHRSASRLLDVLRDNLDPHLDPHLNPHRDLEHRSEHFAKMGQLFKAVAMHGNVSFSLGTYYWVAFVGRGDSLLFTFSVWFV